MCNPLRRSHSTLAAVVVCAASSVLSLPAAATAQAADSVHACYVPLSGTIYRIKAAKVPASCTRPEHVAFALGTASSVKATGAAAGGQAIDHGALTGLTDDDHPQYLLANAIRPTTNGFDVTGTLSTGTIPVSGPGTRLMWYPGKAALRAGTVSGDMWDDAKIGVSSIALGQHTVASGPASLALVSNSRATAANSAAIGNSAVATGSASIALGAGALAAGSGSAALGRYAVADGTEATAIGRGVTASGYSSLALGGNAIGSYSVAVKGQATGSSAVSIGTGSEASGDESYAVGHASTNGKRGAVVIGDNSIYSPVRAQIDNHFVVRAARMWFGNNSNVTATTGRFIETSTGAYLSSGGAWVSSSDSTKKHRWQDVNGEDVLAKLSALPVRTWSYREEADSVRHMGPTAQEFRAAFGLGDTDKAIATVDADGVALAAAQTLERRTRALMDEVAALRAEIASLRAELAASRR